MRTLVNHNLQRLEMEPTRYLFRPKSLSLSIYILSYFQFVFDTVVYLSHEFELIAFNSVFSNTKFMYRCHIFKCKQNGNIFIAGYQNFKCEQNGSTLLWGFKVNVYYERLHLLNPCPVQNWRWTFIISYHQATNQ